MRFTCTFTMDNDAFAASEGDELNRILQKVICQANSAIMVAVDAGHEIGIYDKIPIRDLNGNYIGYWLLEADLP